MDKPSLRTHMRKERQKLSLVQQREASLAVLEQLHQSNILHPALRVGVYSAVGSELDIQPVVDWFWQQKQAVFFPVVEGKELRFVTTHLYAAWHVGAYGVPVPEGTCVDAKTLDIILVPTLGFDAQGARLGQGGGFYDRLMAAIRQSDAKALFIGVAYTSQACEHLPTDPWDQPLNGIVTEESYELLVNEI